MKKLLLFSLMLWFGLCSYAETIDRDRLVNVICELEGGSWGKLGGRGCMKSITWYQHSNIPFCFSSVERYSKYVYLKHILWLEEQILKSGSLITPQAIACAWRHGISGARIRGFQCSYSERAKNLYYNALLRN